MIYLTYATNIYVNVLSKAKAMDFRKPSLNLYYGCISSLYIRHFSVIKALFGMLNIYFRHMIIIQLLKKLIE